MLEAVIVVPVLGILLVASLFLFKWYLGGQHARVLARRCAWEHAMSGCGDTLPPGCDGVLAAASSGPTTESVQLKALADGSAPNSSTGGLSEVPLLGDALDALFGTSTVAEAKRRVRLPWRTDAIDARGKMVVLCNTQPIEIGAAIEELFCDALPVVDCGG
jgi:hypothetical protein